MNPTERETCTNIARIAISAPDGGAMLQPDEVQILARGFLHAIEAHDQLIEDCLVTDPLCKQEAAG